jgi:predicted nuclease of predicted toxin-antitoxin system
VRARLYLDEDVPPDLARLLRTRGTDAVSVHEINALGLPDEAQLARAAAEGRALVTCNFDDFLLLARSWQLGGQPHAGVVISYHQYRRRELGLLLRTVLAFLETVDAENLRNSVQVLDAFHSAS